jgi:hypothetical protein
MVVYVVFVVSSWFVHCLCMVCSLFVHGLFMIFSWFDHGLCMDCSWFVPGFRGHSAADLCLLSPHEDHIMQFTPIRWCNAYSN